MKNCEAAYTPEKSRKFLEEICSGKKAALAAQIKDTGKVIGYILFHGMGEKPEENVYENGWIFHQSFWRKGHAYEARASVVAYAFQALRAHTIFPRGNSSCKFYGADAEAEDAPGGSSEKADLGQRWKRERSLLLCELSGKLARLRV